MIQQERLLKVLKAPHVSDGLAAVADAQYGGQRLRQAFNQRETL